MSGALKEHRGMILLNAAQADQVRGPVGPGHRLEPRAIDSDHSSSAKAL
jgi:hypothetical protein